MTLKHEAVNQILRSVGKFDQATAGSLNAYTGDTPTNEAGGSSYASYAERFLDQCDISTQSMGWYWNTEFNRTATPDAHGYISVPSPIGANGSPAILSLDSTAEDSDKHVIIKYCDVAGKLGDKLYDLENNTFIWAGPIKVKFTYQAPFNKIPESAVSYMVAKSALELNVAYQLNDAATGLLSRQAVLADARMRRDNIEKADINVLETNEANAIRGRNKATSRRWRA